VKIKKVTFHNYRVYAGIQTIDLSRTKPGKPVILVGGLNGEGKTTLLEGIQLALYGRMSDMWKHNGTIYTDYLVNSIHRGAESSGGALVEVEFEAIDQAEMKLFKVQRSWKVNGSGKVQEFVQVFLNGRLDKLLSETWSDQVERFIPARLAGLFFFDGEKIRHFADPQRSQELLERGILALLGIDLVDQLAVDLQALERKITKTVKIQKQDKVFQQLKKKRDELDEERTNLFEKRAGLQSEFDQQAKECKLVDQKYEKIGGQLFEQRITLEKVRDNLSERRSELKRSLIDLSAGPLPLALISDKLISCQAQMKIELSVARAETTTQAVKSQKRRLKKRLRDARAAKKILSLLDVFYKEELRELSEIAGLPVYLETDELDFVNANKLIEKEIPNAQEKGDYLLKQIEELEAEIQTLDRKLSSVPDEEALAAIIQKRDTSRHNLAVLEGKILQIDEAKRLAEIHFEEADVAFHKHVVKKLERSQNQKDDARTLKHSEHVRQTLKSFKKRLISHRIEMLQEIILDSYVHLMRKKGMVAELSIDPATFSLKLRNRDDQEILPEWLSAGERQLLVVSILWGLARASGKSLPIIVDTPVGRLDSAHRSNLVRHYYPQASHQVVLLSTDEEIVGTTLKTLKPAIGHMYRLVYDDSTESTRVESGYFVERENVN